MFGTITASAVLAAAQLAGVASGFQIHGHMAALTRLDPIVSPGLVSGHAHMFVGGTGLDSTLTTAKLRQSKCSTLETQQDKSAYWVAPPYGRNANGTWSALPNTNLAIYYLRSQPDKPITIFPDNFRMVMGGASATLANQNSDWTSFQCNNYIPKGDVTGTWNFTSGLKFLPTMDCTLIKMAIEFPNCWDGQNVDSADHRSHMSYATGPDSTCPTTHPVQVPQIVLEYEFYAEGYRYQDVALSSGSKSGAGVHGDYFFGWTAAGVAAMARALDDPQCMNSAGILPGYPASVRCDIMAAVADEAAMDACNADMAAPIVREEVGVQRPVAALPGCNPLYDGPGLPPTKPTACPVPAATPAIGAPSRLLAWKDGDPRHKTFSVAVFDAPAALGQKGPPPAPTTLVTSTRTQAVKPTTAATSSKTPAAKPTTKPAPGGLGTCS